MVRKLKMKQKRESGYSYRFDVSVRIYEKSFFGRLIEPTFNKGDKEIIDELHDFGINSLTQLDGIIPNDYLNVCKNLSLVILII